jgi:hypothetical protein
MTLNLTQAQLDLLQYANDARESIPVVFEIMKLENNPLTGFNGAILQNVETGQTILWADGSKGFNNLLTSNNPVDTLIELINDWGINNVGGIGSGSIFPQLQDLKAFAESYGLSNIDVGIGHSMMGIGMSALAFTQGFENIQFRAYNGTLSYDLLQKITTDPNWGTNLLDGANLETYITPGDWLTRVYEPVLHNNSIYMKESTDAYGLSAHGAAAHNNTDGLSSTY